MAGVRKSSGFFENLKELRRQNHHLRVQQLVKDRDVILHRKVDAHGAFFTVPEKMMLAIFCGNLDKIFVLAIGKVALGKPQGCVPMPVRLQVLACLADLKFKLILLGTYIQWHPSMLTL